MTNPNHHLTGPLPVVVSDTSRYSSRTYRETHMPIEVGIWKLGAGSSTERVQFTSMTTESRLEDILDHDIAIMDPKLLVVGRQVLTAFGKFVDLLAMDADGKLVVIELKRDRTPREVVAQLLDYGSWVRTLEDEDIAAIFEEYVHKYHPESAGTSLDQAFCKRFGVTEMPETLNEGHELVVVASELDDSTERIVNYLADEYGAAINAVFFRFFRDGDREYLSRVWLIDPSEAEVKVVEKRGDEPWNGEFYVSFGENPTRRWQDAQKHGYIAAGGGAWYSNTLNQLNPGDRIWVNVPGRGYVGVGRVAGKSTPITEFKLADASGAMRSIKELVPATPDATVPSEEQEHFVKVNWIKTVPLDAAIKEKGFFGNQNSVAKPKAKKWIHTIERLKKRFSIDD
ncbi:MAG: endonuclease NucS domain-containing protein [Aureliella sp.]